MEISNGRDEFTDLRVSAICNCYLGAADVLRVVDNDSNRCPFQHR
jgi:hypothetical protein